MDDGGTAASGDCSGRRTERTRRHSRPTQGTLLPGFRRGRIHGHPVAGRAHAVGEDAALPAAGRVRHPAAAGMYQPCQRRAGAWHRTQRGVRRPDRTRRFQGAPRQAVAHGERDTRPGGNPRRAARRARARKGRPPAGAVRFPRRCGGDRRARARLCGTGRGGHHDRHRAAARAADGGCAYRHDVAVRSPWHGRFAARRSVAGARWSRGRPGHRAALRLGPAAPFVRRRYAVRPGIRAGECPVDRCRIAGGELRRYLTGHSHVSRACARTHPRRP